MATSPAGRPIRSCDRVIVWSSRAAVTAASTAWARHQHRRGVGAEVAWAAPACYPSVDGLVSAGRSPEEIVRAVGDRLLVAFERVASGSVNSQLPFTWHV